MPTHAIILENAPTVVAVYQKTTILTDAPIKTLPTSAVEVLPAPGAGKLYKIVSASAVVDATAGVYADISGASFSLLGGSEVYLSCPALAQAALGNGAGKEVLEFPLPYNEPGTGDFSGINVAPSLLLSSLENQPVFIKDAWTGNEIDYTGGNAANTIEVTIQYSIVDL